jgi:hypothetical protein
MMLFRAAFLAVSFAAFAVPSFAITDARAAQEGPDAIAEDFYAQYLTIGAGVPEPKELARISPLLSPSLLDLLKGAEAAEAAYAKANAKEAVPPLVEGDLFSSLFEGADKYKVGLCHVSDQNVFCSIVMSHSEGGVGVPKTTDWTDTLILAADKDGSWKVDDILFGGMWDFARMGSLKDTLRDVIEQGKDAAH